MSIDWSKAPAHATHWCIGNARIKEGWIYKAGGEFYSCYADSGLEHIPAFPDWRKGRLIQRPPINEWTGEGLPPVGAMVIIDRMGLTIWEDAEQFIGPNVKVLANYKAGDEDMIVVESPDERSNCCFRACMATPMRTPEQIADDELQEILCWLQELLKARGLMGIAESLHANGYRKQAEIDKQQAGITERREFLAKQRRATPRDQATARQA